MSRVVGVDVGGTNTKLVVVAAGRKVEHRSSFKTQGAEGPGPFVRRLVACLEPHFTSPSAAEGLGLAVAGLVDLKRQIVQAPNLPRFVGFDLAGEVLHALGEVPLAFDNDVNAALWGEYREGAARGARHAAMLSLGTGVGGGLLLDGRIYRGAGGTAAELGHTLLDFAGPDCPCGQRGHVESYLSAQAIVDHARRRIAQANESSARSLLAREQAEGKLSPRIVGEAADEGDELAQSILAEVGVFLGLACASIVNAFNPEVVLVGGGVAGSGEHLLSPARRTLRERAMPRPGASVRLVRAALGSEGAARGAAHLASDLLAGLDSGTHPGD